MEGQEWWNCQSRHPQGRSLPWHPMSFIAIKVHGYLPALVYEPVWPEFPLALVTKWGRLLVCTCERPREYRREVVE